MTKTLETLLAETKAICEAAIATSSCAAEYEKLSPIWDYMSVINGARIENARLSPVTLRLVAALELLHTELNYYIMDCGGKNKEQAEIDAELARVLNSETGTPQTKEETNG